MILNKITRFIRRSSIGKGFIATLIGSGTSKVVLVIATFVCSNLLGKAEFGELSFVRNTLNMVLCICALNFSSLCTKFTTEGKQSKESLQKLILLFLFSFSVCIICGLILLISPETLLLNIFDSSIIVKYFRIAAVFLPLFIVQPLVEGVARGLKRFKLIGALQTVSSIVYLLVITLGIHCGGLRGALIAVLIYYAIYSSMYVVYLVSQNQFWNNLHLFKNLSSQLIAIRKMILPVFITSFIEAPIMWIAQLLLSKFGDMASVGSMTAMMQIRNLAILIPGYFMGTYIAFAGELNSQKKFTEYFDQFQKIGLSFLECGVALFVLFSLLAKPILHLYGAEFISDWPSMIISNFSIPILMLISVFRVDLILQEHQQSLLIISIVWNSIWLISLYLLLRLGSNPLCSFFISQNIGAAIYLISLWLIFKKDKTALLLKTSDNYDK